MYACYIWLDRPFKFDSEYGHIVFREFTSWTARSVKLKKIHFSCKASIKSKNIDNDFFYIFYDVQKLFRSFDVIIF